MNSLIQQLEKYKNMYNDKKGEYNAIMEKFNELQRQTDGMGTSEKKLVAQG
jgi:hypothetical protein